MSRFDLIKEGKIDLEKWYHRFMYLLAFALLIFILIERQKPGIAIKVSETDQAIMGCLPDDQGMRSVLWLESQGKGLVLRCEKHKKSDYGRAKTKPATMSFLVPVDVD